MELRNTQKASPVRRRLCLSQPWRSSGGIATIELLIAFAIIVLALTGVIVVVFGNQSIALDAELNNLALYKAEEKLEDSFGESRQGFGSIASASVLEGIFSLETEVTGGDTDCFKLVKSSASWWESTIRPQDLALITWFANPDAVAIHAGDCPTHPQEGIFDDPNAFKETDIGGEPSTDVDVLGDYIYMTANAAAVGKSDFYVYLIADLVNDISDDPLSEIHTGEGLNRVDVGKFGSDVYAYALSGDRSDVPEIHTIRVTDPSIPIFIGPTLIPDVSVTCPGPYCPPSGEVVRGAIAIGGDYLYVGVHRISDDDGVPEVLGHEFHIYSLANPEAPSWVGSRKINHNINDIVVSGDYVFLATSDNSGEVLVLNVSNPLAPDFAGTGFDADGSEDAKSLALIGTDLYLGRRNAGVDGDFYVIDASNPELLDALSSPYDMSLNGAKTDITGIVVRETVSEDIVTRLAFLGVNDPNESLFILVVTDPTDIHPVSVCTDGYNTQQKPTGIDMNDDGTYVFMSNESQRNLKIIEDDNSC